MFARTAQIGIVILAACTPIGCSRHDAEPETRNALTLAGAGSTFAAPLYEKWIAKYEATHNDVRLTYESVGSGEGVKQFLAGEIDFAGTDAPLTPQQVVRAHRGAQLIPIGAGNIALAYNLPEADSQLRLSREAYVGIFLGEIKSWDDQRIQAANPGTKLPHRSIMVVVRLDASGTTFAFTKQLSAISHSWRIGPGAAATVDWPSPAVRGRGNDGVAGHIKRTPGAIGYVEFGTAHRADLSVASLENNAGRFVTPTGSSGLASLTEAGAAASEGAPFPDPSGKESYPIVTYTWLVLPSHHDDSAKAASLRDFAKWCTTAGQQDNESLGYIQLPSAVAVRAVQLIESPGGNNTSAPQTSSGATGDVLAR